MVARRDKIILDDVLMDKIVDYVASGKTITEVARLSGFPGRLDIYDAVAEDEGFRGRVERAIRIRSQGRLDSLKELADKLSADEIEINKAHTLFTILSYLFSEDEHESLDFSDGLKTYSTPFYPRAINEARSGEDDAETELETAEAH